MGKEALYVPEESLPDVVRVLRAGLQTEAVPPEVKEALVRWCHEMCPGLPERIPKPAKVLKIGIDIGGVITKYPDVVLPLMNALRDNPLFEVHVLTDMPRKKALKMLRANKVTIHPDRLHACDYAKYGEQCKAVKAEELGLDMLWDDHMGYVSMADMPALRLFVMPDPTRDYYHPTWKTPGDDPSFGRVLQKKDAALDGQGSKKPRRPRQSKH